MGLRVPLRFFNKDDFSIKQPTKVDMLLNKETKPNQGEKVELAQLFIHS